MPHTPAYNLFPELTPYQEGLLQVSPHHQLYYEQSGNPAGIPVVFLHGGPGSGCNPGQRRFFDPLVYRIILLDQRGCGRSLPLGSIEENDIEALIADIDTLRQHLDIPCWLVFGGSWGSTLGLAYAIAHPDKVTGLVLRGIFLSRAHELDWFMHDVRVFYPEAWDNLANYLPEEERETLLDAYAERVFTDDTAISIPAAINWNAFEAGIMTLLPPTQSTPPADEVQLARARVQIHYIRNRCFVGNRDLLAEAKALADIPTVIVQGRYDMVCPPRTAWELHQAMPHAEFHMIPDAGHSGMEAGTMSALVGATEHFKKLLAA